MTTDTTEMVGTGKLRDRGWTESAIRRFLGEPDQLAPNPIYRSQPPMRLYTLNRVTAAENTDEWRAWRVGADTRSARAKRAADTRRQTLLDEVAAIRVTVPVLEWDRLAAQAVKHRNMRDAERAWDRDWDPDPASVHSVDEATLHRWMVNLLRHQHTGYDADLDSLYARVGRAEAAVLIRRRVCAAIGETYPALAAEAARQGAGWDRPLPA